MLHGQDLGSLLGGKLEKACLEISGLRLGTGSPTPMMETPMGNQTFNSGLCAGTESELELLPTYVAIPTAANKNKQGKSCCRQRSF